jgi:hypothetical protein
MNDYVWALAVSGTNLFVGGQFTSAGGVSATNIAHWNGTSWSAVGSGVNGAVLALAVSGTNLFAAGAFTMAGGVLVNHIAQWNGSSWSALGLGVNNWIWALAVSGNNLYAGGDFTTASGVSVNNIAQWNGKNWSALGSGVNSSVYALAVSGTSLFAGGQFTMAGTNASAYLAEAILAPPTIVTTNGNFGFTDNESQFGFDVSAGAVQTLVVQGSTNLLNWVPLQTNVVGGPTWHFNDPSVGGFAQRFYRVLLLQ